MAKKLITATVENISITVRSAGTNNTILTIPANTKEYFYVQSYSLGGISATISCRVDNNTSESIPVVTMTERGEITGTYTAEPHIRKSITLYKGETIRVPDFKNYEDAIFIEWPKS